MSPIAPLPEIDDIAPSLFRGRPPLNVAYQTAYDRMLHGLSDDILKSGELDRFEGQVNLVFTSPPFPLNRKKRYGNKNGEEYIEWLSSYGPLLKKMLTPDGSIVMEVGNSWEQGLLVMSTLPIRSLLRFQEDNELYLCQEFVWQNPAKLPSPAQWVNVDRVRVEDSFTKIWWMSSSATPKADIEWTAEVDIDAIAHHDGRVLITPRSVGKDEHYTKIRIQELRRRVQKRTEETIREYLGSMYMFDLKPSAMEQIPLALTYNGVLIAPPTDSVWDIDQSANQYYKKLPITQIGGKNVEGWVGVLKKGGRKFGGFSLFQNGRQIRGFPAAWKPSEIYGGVDDEGANNLIAQRLTGVLLLDHRFTVSHPKDAVLFENDEEDELIKFLDKETADYRKYASTRRASRPFSLSKEKIRDIVQSLTSEFTSGEMKDAVNMASLPPIESIVATNQQRVASLTEADHVATLPVTDQLKIIVSLQDRSEHDPYLTMSPAAIPGEVHVIINALHPYYQSLEACAAEECIHQYIYDAVAEYRAHQLSSRIVPDTVRRLKDALLKVPIHQNENANFDVQYRNKQGFYEDSPGN